MAAPLTVKRNDFHSNQKKSDIRTPHGICDFLFNLLSDNLGRKYPRVLDVGCGDGRLVEAFSDYFSTVGIDDRRIRNNLGEFIHEDFLIMQKEDFMNFIPALVMCNPPFNNNKGRKLMPEVFVKKIFVPLSIYAQVNKICFGQII